MVVNNSIPMHENLNASCLPKNGYGLYIPFAIHCVLVWFGTGHFTHALRGYITANRVITSLTLAQPSPSVIEVPFIQKDIGEVNRERQILVTSEAIRQSLGSYFMSYSEYAIHDVIPCSIFYTLNTWSWRKINTDRSLCCCHQGRFRIIPWITVSVIVKNWNDCQSKGLEWSKLW